MGRAERGVILLLIGLAVAGHAVQLGKGRDTAPGDAVVLASLRAASPKAHRDSAVAHAQPLRSGERLDPDRASVADLARLPGIGMRLAKEIVADREIRGPFGKPEGLWRVDGIGPATVRRLEPFLRFSAPQPAVAGPLNLNTATGNELERLPGIGPRLAGAILAYRDKHGAFADPSELEHVPGIGPRLARRLAELVTVR